MQLLYAKVLSGCVIFVVTLLCGVGPFLLLRSSLRNSSSHRRGREHQGEGEGHGKGEVQGHGKEVQGHSKGEVQGHGKVEVHGHSKREVQGHSHSEGGGHGSSIHARLNSMQCFACGVFLATCLLHLLPEAREAISDANIQGLGDLPVSETIVSLGFLLLLLVENLVLACHSAQDKTARDGRTSQAKVREAKAKGSSKRNHRHKKTDTSTRALSAPLVASFQKNSSRRSSSVIIFRRQPIHSSAEIPAWQTKKHKEQGTLNSSYAQDLTTLRNYGTVHFPTASPVACNGTVLNSQPHSARAENDTRAHSSGFDESVNCDKNLYKNKPTAVDKPTECSNNHHDHVPSSGSDEGINSVYPHTLDRGSASSHRHDDDIQESDIDSDSSGSEAGVTVSLLKKNDKGHKATDEGVTDTNEDQKAALKSLVLLLALSLHTVFDGLVVGLQDTGQGVWTLLAAVSLHKALVSASVSLSLLESHHNHPKTTLTYLSLFSLVAPIGVAVGAALTEAPFNEHVQSLTSGVLQSLATGTFMYVTFVESMHGRFEEGALARRSMNMALLLVGFGCVFLIKILLPS